MATIAELAPPSGPVAGWGRSGAAARSIFWAFLCFLASLFPIAYGRILWPDGLGSGAETLFWPAAGVSLAAVLRLGISFAPVTYIATVVALLVAGRAPGWSFYSSVGNLLEVILAWFILTRAGQFRGQFDRLRPVLALIAASLPSALLCALPGCYGLLYRGLIPASDYLSAVLVWTLANAVPMLIITPALMVPASEWKIGRSLWEVAGWLLLGLASVWVGFQSLLTGGPTNFAFLAFPFCLYAAMRFGMAGTAASLVLVMAVIYGILSRFGGADAATGLLFSIWFVQTFCWVLAALALTLTALDRERSDARTRALEASLGEERARLSALRYQLNPHFLFNTLNSLRATLPDSADCSRDMVTDLADYLRTTLQATEGDKVPLHAEIESVRRYLAIEQRRFGERLHVEMEIAPDIISSRVPVFLLQPLVENAIVHGLRRARESFTLRLRAWREGDQIVVEVANTGKWHDDTASRSRPACGLTNVRQRLELIYGPNAVLHRGTPPGWVCITLRFPE